MRDPLGTLRANVAGTWELLDACRRSGRPARIVVASSDKAYGTQPVLPYTEDQPLEGRHPYDVSKSCADLIASAYANTYGLPLAITRCGNLFGGGDLNFSRLVPGTIRHALRGERPVLRSDGSPLRDYLHVDDAVDAYLAIAERLHDPAIAGEAWNVSCEQPQSVLEMTQRVLAAAGRADLEPVVLGEARHEIPNQYLAATKLRDRLGWAPSVGLEEGLTRTVAWYRPPPERAGPGPHGLQRRPSPEAVRVRDRPTIAQIRCLAPNLRRTLHFGAGFGRIRRGPRAFGHTFDRPDPCRNGS